MWWEAFTLFLCSLQAGDRHQNAFDEAEKRHAPYTAPGCQSAGDSGDPDCVMVSITIANCNLYWCIRKLDSSITSRLLASWIPPTSGPVFGDAIVEAANDVKCFWNLHRAMNRFTSIIWTTWGHETSKERECRSWGFFKACSLWQNNM